MPGFVTLTTLKSYPPVKNAGDDAVLTSILNGVTARMQAKMGRDIFQNTYSLVMDGTGQRELMLPVKPITAVTSLSIDNVNIPASSDSLTFGYQFDGDTLYLQYGIANPPSPQPWYPGNFSFTRRKQNVAIVCTAGYAVVPDDLQLACLIQCAFVYKRRDRLGLASLSVRGETTSYMKDEWDPNALGLMQQYIRRSYMAVRG